MKLLINARFCKIKQFFVSLNYSCGNESCFRFLMSGVFLIGVSLISLPLQAQVSIPKPYSNDKNPKVADASSMEIFGSVPVGNFTGVPQINVPLYNVTFRGLSVPINMGYHNAVGNKPDVMPGSLGMGWVLMTGGSISRSYRELTGDDLTGNPQTQPGSLNPTSLSSWSSDSLLNVYLKANYALRNDSAKYDVFSYNFNGNSGQIFFDHMHRPRIRSTEGESFKIEWLLHENDYFKMPAEAQGAPISGFPPLVYTDSIYQHKFIYRFVLTNVKGIKYTFGGTDASIEFTRPGVQLGDFDGNLHMKIVPMSWQLTSIQAPDGSRIVLQYRRGNIVVTRQGLTLASTITRSKPNQSIPEMPVLRGQRHTLINPVYLDKIITPKETIFFSSTTASEQLHFPPDRADQTSYETYFNYYKDVVFAPTANRFYDKYDQIVVSDNTGKQYKKIKFIYSNNRNTRLKLELLNISGDVSSNNDPQRYQFGYNARPLPPYLSYKVDAYGFFNNKKDLDSTAYFNRDMNAYYLSRTPDSAYAKAEILNKVVYPSGGFTTFDYELHQYGSKASTWPFVTAENPGAAVINTGGLRIQKITDYEAEGMVSSEKTYLYVKDYATSGAKSSGVLSYEPVFSQDISGNLTPPAFFANDLVNFTGTIRSQRFSTSPLNVVKSNQGSHITYSEVVEKYRDNSFKVFKYKNYDNGYHDLPPVNQVSDHTGIQEFWKLDGGNSLDLERGQILAVADYDNNKNLKKKVSYQYNDDASRFNNHVRVFRKGINPIYSVRNGVLSIRYIASLAYTYFPYLKGKVTETFLATGKIEEKSSFKYDDFSRLLKEQTMTASNGAINTIKYNYPQDMVDQGKLIPYQTMIDSNLTGYIIEQQSFLNNVLRVRNTTEYKKNWNNYTSSFLPSMVLQQQDSQPIDTLVQFDSYDKGHNLTGNSTNGGKKLSSIWSYRGQYPVAKVENSSYALVESVLGGKAAIEIFTAKNPTDNELNTFLAPLRANPLLKDALVTTNTYHPMTGITSTTNPSGKTTYYEYDTFSRLKFIRDQDKNITESFCYNYAGQRTDCNLTPPVKEFITGYSAYRSDMSMNSPETMASVTIYTQGNFPPHFVIINGPKTYYFADEELTIPLPTGYYTIGETEPFHAGVRFYYFQDGKYLFSNFIDQIDPKIDFGTIGEPVAQSVRRRPSNDRNYVIRNKILVSDIYDDLGLKNLKIDDVRQSVTYHDGLGRVSQNVVTNGSPKYQDVVTPVTYDNLGRENKKHLPYAESNSSDGSYKTRALFNQRYYYSSANSWENVNKTDYPFTETVYESSPLNTVVEQGAPGADWQVGNGHSTRFGYGGNNADIQYSTSGTAVKLYKALAVPTLGLEHQRTLSSNGVYGPNELYITITRDENWKTTDGKTGTTEEYKDKEGRVVLKRNFNKVGTVIQTLSTYYVYDDLGNLSFVLPSGANPDSGSIDQSVLNNFCYQYRYDRKSRLVEKWTPGMSEWTSIIYNKIDQVVLSQDPNQKGANKWLYNKYDGLGRLAVTGVYTDGRDRNSLQAAVNGHGLFSETRNEGSDYSNVAFPNINTEIHAVNYYDSYNFPGNIFGGATGLQATGAQVKGLLTGTKTAVLGAGNTLLSVVYYDKEGRVVQSKSKNHLGGDDVVDNGYNFVGELVSTVRTHILNGNSTIISNEFTFDHMGRKKRTTENINGQKEVVLNNLEYNEIGQLTGKSIHSIDNGKRFAQYGSYAYNERGWLTNSTFGQFSFQLDYNNNIAPQYNGNISQQLWGYSGNASENSFKYSYDKLNRLTSSLSPNLGESITYDIMGNISSLSRDGYGTNIYTGYIGNKLTAISGFTNSSYSYDANGNLIFDSQKGINLIYNYLNLITNVSGNQNLSYTYSADGNKLRKQSSTFGTTDYVDGIQYQNGSIEFIQTEGALARNNGGIYTYEYTLTDHLGNSRSTFYSNPVTGTVEVLQRDNYYAFGLRKPSILASSDNKYLFNGKELQEELRYYDYGARFYDPIIGRWNAIDPSAEKFYSLTPYNYTDNNPVLNTDPNGMDVLYGDAAREAFINMRAEMQRNDGIDDPSWWQKVLSFFAATPINTQRNMLNYAQNDINYLKNRGRNYEKALREEEDPSVVDQQYEYDKMLIKIAMLDNAVQWSALNAGAVESSVVEIFASRLLLKSSVNAAMGKAYTVSGEVTAVIKDTKLLRELNRNSKGAWVKVYEAGKRYGKKIETHYFRNNNTGQVFDVKVKYTHWHQKAFKKI